MLPVRHVLSRVPMQNGQFTEMVDSTNVFIDPAKVDTFTEISEARRKEQAIPGKANTIIRYVDHLSGYRLIFVEDTAQQLARAMWRLEHGEDPQTPDYGSIPNGV